MAANDEDGPAGTAGKRDKAEERGAFEGAARPARDPAAESEANTIRPRRVRVRSSLASATSEAPAKPAAVETPRSPASSSDSDPWTVPESVRDRFQQKGHRFHFPDGAIAFRDHGRKLSTPSENTEVIRSLVEIARARGWEEITVAGTESFRRQAWREARLEGLAVRGYRPSEEERSKLSQALQRRKEEGPDSVSAPGQTPPAEVAEPGPSPKGREEKITGKLLEHGRESYRFDPHEEMSYFVRLKTPTGERTIWGKDLGRALEKSLTQPQIGDEVALLRTGADPVTVKRRERDAEGNLLKESDLATRRNRWVIERREFLEEREAAAAVLRDSRIAPKEAVKTHPELAGTYLNLHAAEIAARAIRDPQDQKKFVSLVRGALAEAVARGEPLQPVRLRDQATRDRSQERDAPARS
jgi:putative DNA primase/helicase